MSLPVVTILAVVALAIALRLFAGVLDGDRIGEYVRQRGGKLLTKRWSPFGRGWFGERSDRIYEITYEDRDRNRRASTVKTSMFTGVYFTGDHIVHRARDADASPPPEEGELARLRAENARLRDRLAKRE